MESMHFTAKVRVPIGVLMFERDNPTSKEERFERQSFLLNLAGLERQALEAEDYGSAYCELARTALPEAAVGRLGDAVLLAVNHPAADMAMLPDDVIRFAEFIEAERDGVHLPVFLIDSQTDTQVQIR